ncbi:MAG: hypothetical protein QGG17_01675 [Rhodospirillales bacterium]|jgi:hypothetical protein|nr:hypothetical protein [Rhodospirillales bacterium]
MHEAAKSGRKPDAGESVERPTAGQRRWLLRGVDQPGGKLPLFDETGRHVSERTVRSCIEKGWAEPWFANPLKPDWLVCKITEAGLRMLGTPLSGAARDTQDGAPR